MTVYVDSTDFASLGLPAEVATRATAKSISLTRHLSAASRLADSYLAARFVVPLSTWDDQLERVVCAIAAWTVLTVVGHNPESPGHAAVRMGYDDAIAWLEGVRDGALSYEGSGATLASSGAAGVALSDTQRGW